MTLLSRPKPYTALNLNDFEFALPSSLDPSLPIRATVRESHRDTTALRVIYLPAFIRIGRPLIYAESSHELCMGLLDALLGWLSLHQFGFVHRDLSIANVLLIEGEPTVERPNRIPYGLNIWKVAAKIDIPTNIPLCLPGVKDCFSANITSDAPPAESPASPAQLAAEIAALLAKLPAARTYSAAFVVDGDVATDWRTNLDLEAPTTLRCPFSGPLLRTPEFMSLRLHQAMLSGDFPIDDIESFFWLALWATLLNDHYPLNIRSKRETEWQRQIDSADYDKKNTLVNELGDISSKSIGQQSSISSQLLPLLQNWWESRRILRRAWIKVLGNIREAPSDVYLAQFYLFALLGVRDFLKLVVEHCDTLKAYPKFTDTK